MHRYLARTAILLVISCAAIDLSAQTTGQIVGYITDATGSVVQGASVDLLLPQGKTPIFSVITGAEGLFNIASVGPGFYDLVISKTGFERQTVRSIKVDSARTLTPVIELQVQSVRQQIEVIANNTTLQLLTTDVSSTISNMQIQQLPIVDRDPMTLIVTQAGATHGRGFNVIDGQRTSYSNVTLDGINIQDNFLRGNGLELTPNRLSADQVAEISVTTSNAGSEFNGGASHVSFVTPSGTNSHHGTVYWYNRNSAVAANSWFNNRDGIARPNLNQNQVGASLSGPIVKDKLLFFANYEAFRLRQQAAQNRAILTSDAHQGIFTYRDASGVVRKVNVLQSAGVSVDPATQPILSALPGPEKINNFRTGDSSETLLRNTGGYSFLQRSNRTRDNVTLKIDLHASTRNTVAGTFAWNRNDSDRTDSPAGYTVVPKVFQHDSAKLLAIGWRWSPSANLTNELRGGFNLAPTTTPTTETFGAYLLTTPPLISNPVNPQRSQGRETNTFNYTDNATYSRGRHTIQFGFQAQHIRTAPYDDVGITPAYTLGIGSGNTGLTAAQLPLISATDLTAANDLLALLAGYVMSYTQTFNIVNRSSGFVDGATNRRHFLFDQYSFYSQDQWKATSRLTATAGLRYDYFGTIDERDGLALIPQLSNGDPTATLLSNATLDFGGSAAGRPWYGKDSNNFAPNVGLAFAPFASRETVFRAGYTLSFANDEHIAALRNNLNANAGLSAAVTGSGLTGRVSTALPSIPVPAYKVPRTFADNYLLNRQSNFGLPDPNLSTPYVQEWNVGVETGFRGMIVDVRYVGNHVVKALRGYDLNQVVIRENGFLADFLRAQSNGNLARAATGVFDPAYNAAIPGSQVLTVFPLLRSGGNLSNASNRTSIDTGQAGDLAASYQISGNNGSVNFFRNPVALGANILSNSGSSTYNALQIDVRRNLNGLQLQGNYTYSKVLSNTAGDVQNRFEALLDVSNPQLEKARAPFDVTHAFKANGVYALPFGYGHHLNRNGWAPLLSGWSASSFLTWQSGVPFSILSGRGTVNRTNNRSAAVNTAHSPLGQEELGNVVAFRMSSSGPYIVAANAIGTDGRGVAADGSAPFAGQAFFHPDAGTNGSLQRRSFTGPSLFNIDLAVMKVTTIREGQTFEFRTEAFNLLNNATWNVADQTISSATFGRITGTFYESRRIQFSLRYRF